ncbi:hypothetical protein B566_EDAN017969 [Ephemera danica]|nr:hypothetical protein B566_EDAN017969 [Ephemera danica]
MGKEGKMKQLNTSFNSDEENEPHLNATGNKSNAANSLPDIPNNDTPVSENTWEQPLVTASDNCSELYATVGEGPESGTYPYKGSKKRLAPSAPSTENSQSEATPPNSNVSHEYAKLSHPYARVKPVPPKGEVPHHASSSTVTQPSIELESSETTPGVQGGVTMLIAVLRPHCLPRLTSLFLRHELGARPRRATSTWAKTRRLAPLYIASATLTTPLPRHLPPPTLQTRLLQRQQFWISQEQRDRPPLQPQLQAQQSFQRRQQKLDPHYAIVSDDSASSSSANSSVANVGSPKPEKRQANSPLPPPPMLQASTSAEDAPPPPRLEDMYAKVMKKKSLSAAIEPNVPELVEQPENEETKGPPNSESRYDPSSSDSRYESIHPSSSDSRYESIPENLLEPNYESVTPATTIPNAGYARILRNPNDPGYEVVNSSAETPVDPNYEELRQAGSGVEPNYEQLNEVQSIYKSSTSSDDPNYELVGGVNEPPYELLSTEQSSASSGDILYATVNKPRK